MLFIHINNTNLKHKYSSAVQCDECVAWSFLYTRFMIYYLFFRSHQPIATSRFRKLRNVCPLNAVYKVTDFRKHMFSIICIGSLSWECYLPFKQREYVSVFSLNICFSFSLFYIAFNDSAMAENWSKCQFGRYKILQMQLELQKWIVIKSWKTNSSAAERICWLVPLIFIRWLR